MPSLPPDRVEWHLWNWERWMHHARMPGLLPSRSLGFASGSGQDLDEQLEDIDRRLGVVVNQVIRDLPAPLGLAVHCHHGIAVWRRGANLERFYQEACRLLASRLHIAGMV